MSEFKEWEQNGRFALARTVQPRPWNADIGRGAAEVVSSFGSVEAREYFKRCLKAEEARDTAAWQYASLLEDLRACVSKTGRLNRRKVLAIIERG